MKRKYNANISKSKNVKYFAAVSMHSGAFTAFKDLRFIALQTNLILKSDA